MVVSCAPQLVHAALFHIRDLGFEINCANLKEPESVLDVVVIAQRCRSDSCEGQSLDRRRGGHDNV